MTGWWKARAVGETGAGAMTGRIRSAEYCREAAYLNLNKRFRLCLAPLAQSIR